MGFLKKFFRNVIHEQSEPLSSSSFDQLTDGQLDKPRALVGRQEILDHQNAMMIRTALRHFD